MKMHKFVDHVKVYVKGGDGGHGCTSFRREKYIPLGGPDGGDGGRGGNVILKADTDTDSLLKIYYQPHQKADSGVAGKGAQMYGRGGEDRIVLVPCGTEVWDFETGVMVADLLNPGDTYLAAKGGTGGLGNIHFSTATDRAPREHTDGTPGEEKTYRLELKLAADAGLVGFPNVGKSSLLTAISHAHPRIAPYPFTTINPIMGTVVYDDYVKIKVTDVPGLIENAHLGVGLGMDFLRHVERAGTIVHVIDMAGSEGRDPVDDYRKIKNELKLYKEELLKRPFIIVANKMDEPNAPENLKVFKRKTRTKPIPMSCLTGEGIPEFLKALREMVELSKPRTKKPYDPKA
jgi:GTP-binding protein